MVEDTKGDTSRENIAGRLERLPFSSFHTKFALMLTSGEWAESLMLLGNGAILGLVAAYYLLPLASASLPKAIEPTNSPAKKNAGKANVDRLPVR